MSFKTGTYSDKLEQGFKHEKLEGKNVDDVLRLFGNPQDIAYKRRVVMDLSTRNYVPNGELYSVLTYYTDNPVLNSIGWFPCGGTRIFADKNGRLTGIKEYCY